jgi:soluble lytic murein transglycosylase-like protein
MNAALMALFLSVSQTETLPPNLLASICYVESGYDISAVNVDHRGKESVGICQLQERTARSVGYVQGDLTFPPANVALAGRYLHQLLDRYDGDVTKAVSAYNVGHYAERSPGVPVNAGYVVKVLRVWRGRNNK